MNNIRALKPQHRPLTPRQQHLTQHFQHPITLNQRHTIQLILQLILSNLEIPVLSIGRDPLKVLLPAQHRTAEQPVEDFFIGVCDHLPVED